MNRPGMVLGLGLGGLVDGFVLHQLLQWHHLWSSKSPHTTLKGLEANTFADGIFHMVALATVVAGIVMLARSDSSDAHGRSLISFVLVGWGFFNVLDQIVFHLILKAHHIRMGVPNYEVYDWSFFAAGLVLIATGLRLNRRPATKDPNLNTGSV